MFRRSLTSTLVATLAALWLAPAAAHGPTRQKVTETITINASATAVWARMGNFDALKHWHPAVSDSPATSGNTEESVRTVKLKSGGEIVETLQTHDAAGMKYSYRAKQGGALPVTNYSSTILVTANGDKSVVEWRGAFYRGFPNNDPPPDQNDEAALKGVTDFYQRGLVNLKALFEKP